MLDFLVIIILMGILLWMTRPSKQGTYYLNKSIDTLLLRQKKKRRGEDKDEQ